MSVLNPGAKTRQRLARILQKNANISWLCEVGGPFDYDVLIKARTFKGVTESLESLSEDAKDIGLERTVAAQLSITYFAPKFLANNSQITPTMVASCPIVETLSKIDDTDLKILEALIDGPILPLSLVARRLGMSATTLGYRIETLRKRGIIVSFGYRIHSSAFGFSPYLLLIELRRLTSKSRTKLLKLCHEHPNVSFLIENLGAWDFQVGVKVRDTREIPRIQGWLEDELEGEIKKNYSGAGLWLT